ncbi:MAG: hypothetical protein N2662_02150 [Bacteroidales bacterium]|nr:hypothetical protein [Bacteroidales bacterium]
MNNELLLIIFSAIVIVNTLAVIMLVRMFLKSNEKTRQAEVLLKNHEIIFPLRLQAYERLTLMLERISPESLLTRHNQSGLTSVQLHTLLLTSVRNEFEHNLSQQIYVSPKAWELVKNARHQITVLINGAAQQTNPSAPSIELCKKILENVGEYDKLPTTTAIEFMKKEVQMFF